MAFANYEELQQAIADWLDRDDLADHIPDFINLAETRMERECHFLRELDVQDATGVFVSGTSQYALPANTLDLISMRINTDPVRIVEVVSWPQLIAVREHKVGELPAAVAMLGNNMELGPVPTTTDTYTIVYRSGLTHLSNAAPTSALLTRAPDLYLYGALLEAAPFIEDDAKLARWNAAFERSKHSINQQEWRHRTGGGPLRVRPDVVGRQNFNETQGTVT